MAGSRVAAGIMRRWFAGARGLVVDVGGGTGRIKTLLPSNTRHVCIDLDELKLSGYAAKFDDGLAVQGDASMLPLRSGAVDAITFVAVSHHLTDQELSRVFDEIARVQSPHSTFFFFARRTRIASASSSACAYESAGSARRMSDTPATSGSSAIFQSLRSSDVCRRTPGVLSKRIETACFILKMPGCV